MWLNFGRPAPPGRGLRRGRKFLAPPYYSQRAVFASLQSPFSFIMRPSSLGGGCILRRTLSVRLSVCLSVRLSVRPVIITERHVAPPSELQWHTCTFRHALRAAYRTAVSAAQTCYVLQPTAGLTAIYYAFILYIMQFVMSVTHYNE